MTSNIAYAAAAVAAVAMLMAVRLWVMLRSLRADQAAVLGGERTVDLVEHAVRLEEGFEAIRVYVEDVAMRLDQRTATVEERLDHAFVHRALVRYDAYNEMSGRQSLSIALLDASQSGVVLSSIHHRDQARLYAKQIHGGRGELELSPEEEEAVRLALAG